MNKAQGILDRIQELPDVVPIYGAKNFLSLPQEDRTGFFHSNGEWNFLVKHDGRMYRVPISNMERRAIFESGPVNLGGN
jgi:hypothetical protein